MQTVLITGGTGIIGGALSRFLREEGYKVVILTRRKENFRDGNGILYRNWNPERREIDTEALSSADYIIHLAGENIAHGRWTVEKKKKIMESRVKGTGLLAAELGKVPNKIKTIISASAIGYYHSGDDQFLQEKDTASSDFLGEVCVAWEAQALRMATLGKRVVILRTGVVLNAEDGILPQFVHPLKWGIAAIPESGKQWVSWIHYRDLVRLYATALINKSYSGIFNAVAPFPVTYNQFVTSLARHVKGKYYLPFYIPSFVIKTFMGEKGPALIKSSKISAAKLLRTGFEFSFPNIESALENIYAIKKKHYRQKHETDSKEHKEPV